MHELVSNIPNLPKEHHQSNSCRLINLTDILNKPIRPSRLIKDTSGKNHSAAMALHRALAFVHEQNVWNVSSSLAPQIGHSKHVSRFRFILLLQVARELFARRHAKLNTFGGAGQDHRAFQPSRRPSGRLLEVTMSPL